MPLKNRGFLVTGNVMLAGVFFLLVGVFGFNFFSDGQATTTISIEPQGNRFSIEEDITIDVFITSRAPINALDATLSFPPEFLEVSQIIENSPIIDLWVNEPHFSNEEGFVQFTGGTTRKGGVVGKSNILTIVFTPKKAGKISLTFEHSLVLEHDGDGTDLQEAVTDANVIVQELENPQNSNVVHRISTAEYTIKDSGPPDPDLDRDGKVSIKDLSAFLPSLTREYDKKRDFNEDGKINIKDVSIIMSKVLIE